MKKIFLFLVVLAFCLALFPAPAAAQTSVPPLKDADSFTFMALREREIRLFGPFDSKSIFFGLPANWRLLEGAQLQLDMTVAIQSAAPRADGLSSIYGGTLTVLMNRAVVAVIPLNQSGMSTRAISLPLQTLTSLRRDGRLELTFVLSGSEACLVDQKMDVTIHPSSRFVIPHEVVPPSTNLARFPRPLYQDSIFTDSALIVIPPQPTAAELQAALTVAAGLQARTGNSMQIDLALATGLTQDKLAGNHLILAGNAASLPMLYQLVLPMSVTEGGFAAAGDAGVLQMIASPWSAQRVVLVVSGNNDQATVKAAQALSTGVIRPNNVPNLALIANVNSRTYLNATTFVDQTLAGLGYETVVFEGRGETTESFQIYIPAGQTISEEAYFEAAFSHSAILNYARSGVFITMNDKPIGSIRLGDETVNRVNNRLRIPIPPSAVRSGLNYLDVSVLLEPLEECADPNQGGLFFTLWSDSRLYLPLAPAQTKTAALPDLSVYPLPFIQVPELGTTAFILQRDNLDSWRLAIKLAANLGATSDGAIFTPAAFYADDVPPAARSAYNMLVVGLPSKLKLLSEINNKLPGPFEAGGDIANEEELQVVYQIDPAKPAGYLELLASPWNTENLLITVAGNSAQGLQWAARALLDETERPKLLGDFAVVTEDQVIAVDTRLFALQKALVAPPTVTPVVPVGEAPPAPSPPTTPGWLPIAIGLTFLMIFIVSGIALYTHRKSK